MSKPQVTITLGRGQVVKKPGSVADNSHSDYHPSPSSSGTKRSIRDRLGNAGDQSLSNGSLQKKKRQRRDGNKRGVTSDDPDGVRVNPKDLRYKLMRKNMSRKTRSDGEEQQNNGDLREKLSRTAQPPTRPDSRQHISDVRRQRVPDTHQHHIHDPRQHPSDPRQRIPETRQRVLDVRQHMPGTKDNGLLRRLPPARSADDFFHSSDSLRHSYSAWHLDGVRRGSPSRNLGTSRGLSPPRNMSTLRHVASISSVDAARSTAYMSKDVLDASRHASSLMARTSAPLEARKPVVQLPPSSAPGITHKISYTGEETHSVPDLLHSLGLTKYAILFQAEEVDMTALKQMGDHDLKELGIPMGPRKKILLAVSKRPPRGV